MELTKEQVETLEDVFNWAVNFIEETGKDNCLFVLNESGLFERFDVDKKIKKIGELAEYIKNNIKIV